MAFVRALFLIIDTAILAAIPGVSLFADASGVGVFDTMTWAAVLFAPFTLMNIFPGIYRCRFLRTSVLVGGAVAGAPVP